MRHLFVGFIVAMIAWQPTELMAETLGFEDLSKMQETYTGNEIRFKRDFVGKTFRAKMPFRGASEKIFSEGEYIVGFGLGGFTSDIDCDIRDPRVVDQVVYWNKGDIITVTGSVEDSIMGTILLKDCKFGE